MRRHVRCGARRFEHDPDLYRLALPFAILGGQYDRVPEWPWPPTSDPAWVPHALVQACVIAPTYPGQERPETLP
jgi:hypothetical protein